MDDTEYAALQNKLTLLGGLLPEIEEINGMLERIGHTREMEVLAHVLSPIPAMNLAPGYERLQAFEQFARAVGKARKKWDAPREVVGETEARIHRG